jgi:transposase
VAHQTVSDWHDQWLVGGKRALKRVGKPGRPPKVTTQDLAKVEKALERGPRANGFATDLWTLARVAEVFETVTGVQYHPGHVWRVLRQMGWSRQRPARQAIERDDAAIERWVNERWVNERWPKVKKLRSQGGVDRLPRRERLQPPAGRPLHLGQKRLHPSHPPSPEPLEAALDVSGCVFFTRAQRRLPHLRHAPGHL